MKKFPLILLTILFLALLLRFPALFEPNWYGDEGIYQVIGHAMVNGRLLYGQIWDNKPPLLYVIYMLANGEQFWTRLASLLFMFPTIILFYKLSVKMFADTKIVYFTSFLFGVLFAGPLLEGNIANSENFMYLPILLALYLGFTNIQRKTKVYLFIGLVFGIAFLIKIVAIFDLAALFVFLLIRDFGKDIKKWFIQYIIMGTGFVIPIAISVLYFFFHGAIYDFLTATLSQNVTYVEAGNKLFFSQGLLFVKLALLAAVCLFFFFKRNNFSKEYIFIYIWLAFSLFNALFGGRPWIHYLLTLLPAFCLFIGILIEDRRLRLINGALLLILLFIVYKNFWIYEKTLSYYTNFMTYVTGSKNEREYRNFFDWYVNRDYAVAQYIQAFSKQGDTVFLWGNNAQIYALSKRLPPGRYTVAYHVTFYPNALLETKENIESKQPTFIIEVQQKIPHELLSKQYSLQSEVEGAKIYARRY